VHVGEDSPHPGSRLEIKDDVERAVPQELLALPDERLVVEGQPLVLVRGELCVAGAGVDERLLRVVAGVVCDDVADLDAGLVHLRLAAAVESRVDDQPVEFDTPGLEQFPGPPAQISVQHVRLHT